MAESKLTLYSDVRVLPVRWLWKPYIALGKITLLQGDPGDGKSTMMLNLIAELSKGGSTPDGKPLGCARRIIYQCSEDGAADTIKPRLDAFGADCRNIAFINEDVCGGLTLDDERIRDAIIEFKPQLVVIDPIQSYIGSDSDLQIAVRARKLMRRISLWASTYDCAIVLVGHLTKKEGSRDLYRGLGSIDIVASARSVLQVERDPEDEYIRIVKQVKNSLAAKGNDILFEIRPEAGFKWISSASEPVAAESKEEFIPDLPRSKHELAAILIKRLLSQGTVESAVVIAEMKKYNIGEKTMNEAKAALGIKSFRKMRKWYWKMPEPSRDT